MTRAFGRARILAMLWVPPEEVTGTPKRRRCCSRRSRERHRLRQSLSLTGAGARGQDPARKVCSSGSGSPAHGSRRLTASAAVQAGGRRDRTGASPPVFRLGPRRYARSLSASGRAAHPPRRSGLGRVGLSAVIAGRHVDRLRRFLAHDPTRERRAGSPPGMLRRVFASGRRRTRFEVSARAGVRLSPAAGLAARSGGHHGVTGSFV